MHLRFDRHRHRNAVGECVAQELGKLRGLAEVWADARVAALETLTKKMEREIALKDQKLSELEAAQERAKAALSKATKKGGITQEDIAEVSKAIFGG